MLQGGVSVGDPEAQEIEIGLDGSWEVEAPQGRSRRLQALQRASLQPYFLVRGLGSFVEPQALGVAGGDTVLFEGQALRSAPVRCGVPGAA